MDCTIVEGTEDLIKEARAAAKSWGFPRILWFRGEPANTDKPLVPKVFRQNYDENTLLQLFRLRAPVLSPELCPERENTDQWLFLAQHVGLPTRLLDWTESLLSALYFALLEKEKGSVVWMLHPTKLNQLATGSSTFELAWFSPGLDPVAWIRTLLEPDRRPKFPRANYRLRLFARLQSAWPGRNFANEGIRGAWENDRVGTAKPIAIVPTLIHPRMASQRSCFTIHRKSHAPLPTTLDCQVLRRFQIAPSAAEDMLRDLAMLGVTRTTVFPDLEALAAEISDLAKRPDGGQPAVP